MKYYIADSHFFHAAMNFHMDNRGFKSVEEMNKYMIKQWNRRVKKKDEVYVLGDLSFGTIDETKELLKKLNGKLYILKGNHDKWINKLDGKIDKIKWIKDYDEIHDNGRKVILSHYPNFCYRGQYRLNSDGTPKTYMLHGHVHNTHDQMLVDLFQKITRNTPHPGGNPPYIPCNIINCFCMYSDYVPLTLDEWIEVDKKRREDPVYRMSLENIEKKEINSDMEKQIP